MCVCRPRNASRATLPGHWPCASLSSLWPCFLSPSSSSPAASTWWQTAPTSCLSPTVKPWWKTSLTWRSRTRPDSSSAPSPASRRHQCRYTRPTWLRAGANLWTPTLCLQTAATVRATRTLPSAPPHRPRRPCRPCRPHWPRLPHQSLTLDCCPNTPLTPSPVAVYLSAIVSTPGVTAAQRVPTTATTNTTKLYVAAQFIWTCASQNRTEEPPAAGEKKFTLSSRSNTEIRARMTVTHYTSVSVLYLTWQGIR